MVKVTELIVLHTTKFGENSIVVHTLSKEYGRRGFVVRSAGKKSVMTLFQPLSVLEAEITESSKSTTKTFEYVFSFSVIPPSRGNTDNSILPFVES